MKKIQFKTNLKCSGCVEKVAKILDNNPQIKAWKVNLASTDKELEVETTLSENEIQSLILAIGFKLEVK